MKSIKIGGNTVIEEINDIIEESFFENKIKVNIENYEDRFIYNINIGKLKKGELEEIVLYLGKVLTDIIFSDYLLELVKTRVKKLLRDFNDISEDIIIEDVLELIKVEDLFLKEKANINKEISNYLLKNGSIIIDGYVKFRPNSFYSIIDVAVGKAIGDIQSELDYKEFLNMLQYYMDTQIPNMDLVNVIIKEDDFILLDSFNKEIKKDFTDDIIEEIFYDDVSRSDILLSSLIVLAPLKILIHIENDKEKDLMIIFKEVFRDRISFCNGCSLCKLKEMESNE